MSRRITFWLIAGIGVLLVACGNAASDTSQQVAARAYQEGANLGGVPAPAFTLQDQTGATVSLNQFHGHPVVLTFFDSVCPHAECSLMAEYLNWTARDLGPHSAQVDWVALTVNPWHDTPALASTFLSVHQVTMRFHYLLGTPAQMAPLWSAYHMQAMIQSNGIVIHSTGVYVLDAQGRERLFLDEGFDPKVLSGYLDLLLTEPAAATAAHGAASPSTPSGSVVQLQTVSGDTIALTATPAQYGTYTFTVAVQDANGVPVQGAAVDLDLTMPGMQMSPLSVHLSPVEPPVPGAYRADGVLSMIGQWQAVVRVVPAGASQLIQATFHFTSTR
jgi:protein SCO1